MFCHLVTVCTVRTAVYMCVCLLCNVQYILYGDHVPTVNCLSRTIVQNKCSIWDKKMHVNSNMCNRNVLCYLNVSTFRTWGLYSLHVESLQSSEEQKRQRKQDKTSWNSDSACWWSNVSQVSFHILTRLRAATQTLVTHQEQWNWGFMWMSHDIKYNQWHQNTKYSLQNNEV